MVMECQNLVGENLLLLDKLLHNACNKVSRRLILLLIIAVYVGNSNMRRFDVLNKMLDDDRSTRISQPPLKGHARQEGETLRKYGLTCPRLTMLLECGLLKRLYNLQGMTYACRDTRRS